MKECMDVLISLMTKIVNKSLSMGVFPRSKEAVLIKPLIKNSLDCNILNNYRSVSNVTFLSKFIKRGVAFHLNTYIININLNGSLQSVYKSGHSTETAFVWVKHYIMMSINQGMPVLRILLDQSPGFNAPDHNVLVSRLKDMLGMSRKVLEWFRFGIFYVMFSCFLVLCGVPRGSILCQVFTMYTCPFGIIAQTYRVKYHLYADDTHRYISLDPDNEFLE